MEPKKVGKNWFSADKGAANDTEVLFFALLVTHFRESVNELDKWASDVLAQQSAFLSGGDLPDSLLTSRRVKVPPLLQRVHAAYSAEHTVEMLEKIGKAIQQWPGAGGIEDLTPSSLGHHRSSTKKNTQQRWKQPAAFFATAQLIKSHGIELRKLLGDETPRNELVTPRQQITKLEKESASRQKELEATQSTLFATADAHRKALARSVETRTAVKTAVKGARREAPRGALEVLRQEHRRGPLHLDDGHRQANRRRADQYAQLARDEDSAGRRGAVGVGCGPGL